MEYKELFRRIGILIVAPKKAWVELVTESPRRDVMAAFVYPLIALCGLAVLLGTFMRDGMDRGVYQPALMEMCSYCFALFGGFFLASYLTDMIRQNLLMQSSSMPAAQFFAGYAMSVVFVSDIIVALFPQFFIFKWVLMAYTLKIVWEGSEVVFAVDEERRMTFTALVSVALVFSPTIIRILFNTLSNLLG